MRTPPFSFFLLLVLALGLSGCGSDSDPSRADAPETRAEARSGSSYDTNPQPAPDTTLKTLQDSSVVIGGDADRLLLVNFWATWCAPCRKEIPDLVDLQGELGKDGLTVVGISVDQGATEDVRAFAEKYEVNYPIVHDPEGRVDAEFGATYGLPTTYVINPDGQIVRRIVGIFPTEEMRPQLEAMLEGSEREPT